MTPPFQALAALIAALIAPPSRPPVAPAPLADVDPSAVAGTHLRWDSAGTLSFHWQPADLPAGVTLDQLEVARLTPIGWQQVTGATSIAFGTATIAAAAPGEYEVRWHPPSTPCLGAAYRLLDYRQGKWDYRAAGYDPGRDEFEEDASRCALRDHYADVKGGRSEGFFLFSPRDSTWYSTVIDPGGRTRMRGTMWNDSSAFVHIERDGTTKEREIYRKRADGAITFSDDESRDGGATWKSSVTAVWTRVREE